MVRGLFAWRGTVSRSEYFVAGLSLALLKYILDAVLIRFGAGLAWWPSDYLRASPLAVDWPLAQAEPWLLPVLLIWTVPFLWIGLAMSSRRLRDAGLSEWLSLLFFAPYLSYVLMGVLCAVPSGAGVAPPVLQTPPRPPQVPGRHARVWGAVAAGAIPGVAIAAAAVIRIKTYGGGLFLGVPFVMGVCTAYVFNKGRASSRGETNGVVILSLLFVAAAFMAMAMEGAGCLIMSMPIAIPLALLGSELGRAMASGSRDSRMSILGVAAIPFWLTVEPSLAPPPTLHEVRSSVEIDAAPGAVWPHVIAFPPLPAPTELVFRAGIAAPQRAHIVGEGVGAIRYCEFSTGPFVEPITAWEPGRRLAFDVTASPAPLREWSPYANIQPPHLDGFLRSKRGEFRLVPLADGRTRLEGSTWYEIDMAPEGYWQLWSDYLIHRIHRRVLDHIKQVTEQPRR